MDDRYCKSSRIDNVVSTYFFFLFEVNTRVINENCLWTVKSSLDINSGSHGSSESDLLLIEEMKYPILGIKGEQAENYALSSKSSGNSHSSVLLVGSLLAT